MKVLLDYHQQDTPTSVLFPWLHGIGDGPLGANGPLEQFFGYVSFPSLLLFTWSSTFVSRAATPL
jgi:hypothetical protein